MIDIAACEVSRALHALESARVANLVQLTVRSSRNRLWPTGATVQGDCDEPPASFDDHYSHDAAYGCEYRGASCLGTDAGTLEAMAEWNPISEKALRGRIAQGVARMSPSQKRLWEAIRIDPEKWQQHPYGDTGKGFWVVALIGRTVVWYNDVEEGFNRSGYSVYGEIDDYWCNQDELELTIEYLMTSLERGTDLVRMRNKPV